MNKDIVVIAVDVGSHEEGAKAKNKNFAWSMVKKGRLFKKGKAMKELTQEIKQILQEKHKLALGFEAPVFITPWKEGDGLSRRTFEPKGYYWYNNLPIILISILNHIFKFFKGMSKTPKFVFDIEKWDSEHILIWEAFVSRKIAEDHDLFEILRQQLKDSFPVGNSNRECEDIKDKNICDAFKAALTFYYYYQNRKSLKLNDDERYPKIDPLVIFKHYSEEALEPKCLNLAGAALLWSGLLDEEIQRVGWECVKKKYLYTPCLVVKTAKPKC